MTSVAAPRPAGPAGPGADVTSWALAALARADGAVLPDPPAHDRLSHLAEVLALGPQGLRLVALFYGLWQGAGTQGPVSAAQARRAVGGAHAGLRGLTVGWEVLSEVAVAPGAPLALALDETIGDWLDGGAPIPPRWQSRVSGRAALPPPACWPVADLVARAQAHLAAATPGPLVLRIAGPPGSGRRSLAAAVGHDLGTAPLFTDLTGLSDTEAQALIRLVERAALLTLSPPAWFGGEGVTLPEGQPRFALQFDITGPHGTGLGGAAATTCTTRVGPLPLADRAAAWARLCPAFAGWEAEDKTRLTHLTPATIGEIARIGGQDPGTPEAARDLLRQDQRSRLNPAIQPRSSGLAWGDLVLPDRLEAALRRLEDEIALSPALWSEPDFARLYGQSRGVFALFSGPPGTGKTMAAEVIARDLGLDLYVVDSGSITSKYVGETAQNLQAILAQAEADAAVLFFDEADGLFGKRTETRDAHARYLNSDTNVLLQAVETHAGACILATNRRDNVDPAFLRRLRHICEFPRPDAALRGRMWRQLVVALSPDTAGALDPICGRLSAGLDLTGAQIKNALRTALIAARRDGRSGLTPADLLAGAEHELTKEGRALTRAELARLEQGHG